MIHGDFPYISSHCKPIVHLTIGFSNFLHSAQISEAGKHSRVHLCLVILSHIDLPHPFLDDTIYLPNSSMISLDMKSWPRKPNHLPRLVLAITKDIFLCRGNKFSAIML